MGSVILVRDLNGLFQLIMVDFGWYLKTSHHISSVYFVLDFNGSSELIMVDFR